MVKTLKAISKDVRLDASERTAYGVITTEAIDRDSEVILTRGIQLENYQKNPVVLFMHDPFKPVGKSLYQKIRKRNGIQEMVAKTKFADTDLANEVFTLMEGDFLRGFSVGLAKNAELREVTQDDVRKRPDLKSASYIISKSELVEYSVVTVPANQDALLAAKRKGLIKLTEPDLEPWLKSIKVVRKKPYIVPTVKVIRTPRIITAVNPQPGYSFWQLYAGKL